ncbi:holin [Paenibacillus kribbensis]|uniref:holin n=1 Tax=Paenibacillus kribbensis TaxID=172713 RepID=UPI002DB9D7E7|nr:holin [Paenibacillus kribbensis]MEC0234475.1 holin [Paenibacillus kribbensis]
MNQVLAFASTLAVIIIAVVQLVKNTIKVPVNIVPVIGVVTGLGIGWLAAPFTDLDLTLRLWAGGLAGLSATGLFELAFKDRPGTTKDDKVA